MKGCTPLTATIVLILTIASFMPLAAADGNSLRVELTVVDKEYKVGDTVTVQMAVYNNGLPAVVDAGNVTLMLSDDRNLNNYETLALTPAGIGVYSANYVILEDADDLYFFYEVNIGSLEEVVDHYRDALYIEVSSFQNTVDVNFYGQEMITAKPGDTVTATIEVRYGDTLLDPESFDELLIRPPTGSDTELTETKVETGIYETTITIPSVTDSGRFEVRVRPNTGGQDTATIQVNVLNVWYHKIDIVGDDIAQFEVGVADNDGLPVNGATIAIERWDGIKTKTTNESGLAFFSISGIWDTTEISGFVRSGSLNQSFEGMIYNPQEPNPGNDLDIFYLGDESIYSVNEEVSRLYSVYFDDNPVSGSSIYYYVTAYGTNFDESVMYEHIDGAFEIVASGVLTTDTTGKFTLTFTAPAAQAELYIEFELDLSALDGGDYEEWPEWGGQEGSRAYVYEGNFIDDDLIKIKTGSIKEGEPVEVTVEMETGYEDVIMAVWNVGVIDVNSPTWQEDMEWIPWTSTSVPLVKNEDGTYTGEFMIPQFIDTETVTVYAGYTDGDTGFPHYNSAVAEPGGSLLLMLAIVALLIVGMFVFLKFFKSPKKPSYKKIEDTGDEYQVNQETEF